MLRKLIVLFCLLISINSFSQLPDGTIAPNFTGVDLNGEEHNLYDILASGKDVIVDFFFTGCVPCWNWHNTKILEELYLEVGPAGTDEAVILMIESYLSTDTDAIYGIGNNTEGNWTNGASYPILEHSMMAEIYKINSYPTILKICQDRKIEKINGIRSQGVAFGLEELEECPSVNYASEPFFIVDKQYGCGSLEVQFEDQSWPRPTSWLWEFGDGNTSIEQSPLHYYESEGDYSVSLKVTNDFGENQISKTELIKIGDGDTPAHQIVGGVNSGSGSYNEGLNRKLIFDSYDDLIISSVKVYSQKEQPRTIVLTNEAGDVLESKIVNIPEGEHRVELNFFVPIGQNFQLGLASERFLRIDTHNEYPYVLNDLISIHGHTGNDNNYYYFYEWEVRPTSCITVSNNSDLSLRKFSLFPNPSSGMLNLKHPESSQHAFVIYNTVGRKFEVITEKFGTSTQFDISKLLQGVYFLEITIGDKTIMEKFVKTQ